MIHLTGPVTLADFEMVKDMGVDLTVAANAQGRAMLAALADSACEMAEGLMHRARVLRLLAADP